MAYGSLGRAGEQFKQLQLIGGLDPKDIDQGEKLAIRRDRCHIGARV